MSESICGVTGCYLTVAHEHITNGGARTPDKKPAQPAPDRKREACRCVHPGLPHDSKWNYDARVCDRVAAAMEKLTLFRTVNTLNAMLHCIKHDAENVYCPGCMKAESDGVRREAARILDPYLSHKPTCLSETHGGLCNCGWNHYRARFGLDETGKETE